MARLRERCDSCDLLGGNAGIGRAATSASAANTALVIADTQTDSAVVIHGFYFLDSGPILWVGWVQPTRSVLGDSGRMTGYSEVSPSTEDSRAMRSLRFIDSSTKTNQATHKWSVIRNQIEFSHHLLLDPVIRVEGDMTTGQFNESGGLWRRILRTSDTQA
jgi:hypothetical protein